ncbi:YhcN/YlaJ family sporulation lipoprotein [Gracilibacillus halotolerans]|uniref:YhcN/YlaJ family sporulation lipoprotein n=1 Tax=Gracilibacillus halotolerans TaxID=74386 RepID=A0A841RM65_9BACI|nr:YhcN/YlaJ family sporulation lipoprotein [Gracilibacillus halotolerans]MBB6512713.1 YhcN/YlaJ family sporulation lipoprotein [Gracilibacillus halotolerans]
MKWSKVVLTSILAGTLALTACNTNDNDLGQRDGNDNMNTRPVRYDHQNNDPGIDRFSTPRGSGIQSDDHGARDGRTPAETNYPPMNTQRQPDTRMDTGNRDVDQNRNGNQGNTGENNNQRNTGENNNQNQNENNYDVAEKAADRIKQEVSEVNNVYVLTTDNNAYVAATWDKDDEDLSDDTKKKITQAVKSVENDIDNVYITTNPDFFDLTDNYVNDLDERPVRGFFDQIGNMIERVFPNQETTNQ